tara:strand:- start:168 stop:1448 length:1281 start_codon:yes stop_codon:yes gene_type:complete
MYNILILGSGGREHAIAWSIYNDKRINKLFCAPGNAGTISISENIDLKIMNNDDIYLFVKQNNIDLIIVGPEQPLENGIVDFFEEKNIKIFGPSQYASQLETSKLFARNMMEKYNIPQPAFFECTSEEEILSVKGKLGLPLVLKADGLAAGKGVIICNNDNDLHNAIDDMINNRKFGRASAKVSVEECLRGEELSVFAICDGENYKIINSAQDHKRAYDNDKGPNTGGMGAYSPTPLFTDNLRKKVEEKILKPILDAMKNESYPFKGFLYVGLMIDEGEPYVIEFNVRLGDPEAQVLLPLIKSSVLDMMIASIDGNIENHTIELDSNYAVTVVLSAKGYPEKYNKGMKIKGLNNVQDKIVFHAGTKLENNDFLTNGGRVLNVVGIDENLKQSIFKAYELANIIDFKDKYFRSDIGMKAFKYLEEKE